MMKQKDAVVTFFNQGTTAGHTGEALNSFIVDNLTAGFVAGEIEHKKGRLEEKKARSYAGSLLSNWKKKVDLTSGAKIDYVPANPRGPLVKDPTLVTLKTSIASLKANNGSPELIARAEAAYAARKAEVDAAKATSKVIPMEEALAQLENLGVDIAV